MQVLLLVLGKFGTGYLCIYTQVLICGSSWGHEQAGNPAGLGDVQVNLSVPVTIYRDVKEMVREIRRIADVRYG